MEVSSKHNSRRVSTPSSNHHPILVLLTRKKSIFAAILSIALYQLYRGCCSKAPHWLIMSSRLYSCTTTSNGGHLNNGIQTHSDGLVRLVVISDTHNRHKAVGKLLPLLDDNKNGAAPAEEKSRTRIPTPTILIHCGDFADRGSILHVRSFCRWLARDENNPENLPALPSYYNQVVVIGGNHDMARPPAKTIDLTTEFAKCNQKLDKRGINRHIYFLQDTSITLSSGLTIYGASWESTLAANYSSLHNQYDDRAPDVLLSHLIPYFGARERQVALSLMGHKINFDAWRGSRELVNVAAHYRVPIVLSGHVHWGRGAVHIPHSNMDNNNNNNGTWFVNAASTKPGAGSPSRDVDPKLEVTPPVVIDYDIRNRSVVHLSCPSH